MRRRVRLTAIGVTLGFVTLLVVDTFTGFVYHSSSQASVVVVRPSSGAVEEALVVFPGYGADGTIVSKAFAPYLKKNQAMIVLRYAQRGIDDNMVYGLVMEQLTSLSPRRVRILSGSLGGIVAARFLARYAKDANRARFGRVVLVLDSVPACSHDVRRPQWMFSLSSWYRGGILSSMAWAAISRIGSRPLPEPGANARLIDEGNEANSWVGMPALTSQASYLASFKVAQADHIGSVVQRAAYLEASTPSDDPLVRTAESIVEWRTILPDLNLVRVATRQGAWHLPWTYRPRETLVFVDAA